MSTDVTSAHAEREARRSLEALVEGIDAIIWEMDALSWRFTFVSEGAERILGYPTERWLREEGFWAGTLLHPADRGWALEFCTAQTRESKDHDFEYRALAADGRVVWLRDVVKVVRDDAGAARLLRGVMLDITAQKTAEAALQQRVRHSALSADVGVAIADGGAVRVVLQRCAEAIVSHLDAAFARVWTLDEAEQVLELQASAGLYTHLDGPHGRVPVGAFKIGMIAEERAPHLTNDVLHDPRVGDKAWAEREGMVAFAGYPLMLRGRLLGVVAMFARHELLPDTLDALSGIADRLAMVVEGKLAELELREREAELAEALHIAGLGRWEWAVGDDRVQWSDELYRIYGLEPQSVAITFEGFLERLHPEDRAQTRAEVERALRTGEPFAFEERIVRPDGEVRVLQSRGEVVRRADGRPLRLVGTCLDVTEQKRAEQRAIALAQEQAARMQAEQAEWRAQFLASASNVLSASLDYEATLGRLAHLVVPELADWCAIDVLDEHGAPRRVVTAHSDPARERLAEELHRRYPPDPDAPMGVPQVLRTGEPELVSEIPQALLDEAARDEEHRRIIRELGLRSYMTVPLIARGRTLGALTFVAAESGRRYGMHDLAFAEDLAHRAALAVDNAELFREAERAGAQVTRILESITDAFFALDHAWRFTYLNDEAEVLLSRPRGTLLGRSIWEEFPAAVGSTFEQQYRRAAERGETVQFVEYYPPLDGWFEVRAYPGPDGLSVYFRNVNEQIATERGLRQSEERFRSLVRASAAIVWTAAASGELEAEQPEWAAYTGQPWEEYRGWGWLRAMHPDDQATTAQVWQHALERRTTYEAEHRLRRSDGEYRHMLARGVPILEEDGSVREWVGVHTDITERRAAEDALRRQSTLTQTITENATSALFMMDERGHCTYMNAAAERMIGYSLDEIRDMPLHDAIHHHYPDGRPFPMHECPIDRALPEDFSVRAHEDVFFRKNGEAFPIVCAAAPIFDDQRRPIGTVVEVRDVTAEKRAQRALEESERQFRFLADAIPVQVWTARPDGALDYVSRRVAEYFGRSEAEVIGAGWQAVVHPDHLQRVVERWVRSLQTGEPYEVEFPLRNASGEYRWHLGRAVAQHDAEGRVVRWFGSNMDIQSHKEAAAERERLIGALDLERSRLEQIFQEAPAFIAVLRGPEHRFETVNPLYVQLVGNRDVVGRTVAEALPEVAEQGFLELLDRVYETREPFIGNELPVLLQRTPGGTPEQVYVNFVYQPILEPDGRASGIFVHGVEVTGQVLARRQVEEKAEELRRLAGALERSNQELDQFAYVTSHDLKAPLRGIANLSQWVEEDLGEQITDEVREHLALMRGRVHRMEALIEGILEYSRAGRLHAETERVEVGELLHEVVELLDPPAALRIEIADAMPALQTERLPLQQVFMNLIGNAIKYVGRDDGRVHVQAAREGAFHHFSVADNGPGIAREYHERIFGIFQTLHARDKVEGTGIGLSLVKKIVEHRGGRVWLDSTEGQGTTFHFTWPG